MQHAQFLLLISRCFLYLTQLSIDRTCHTTIGMTNAANHNRICLDIFRQSHAAIAGIPQMMDISAGHLAHKGNLADGGNIRAFLGGADGGDGETAKAMGIADQFTDIFHGQAGDSAGGRHQNDIGTGCSKVLNILLGDNILCTLCQDAGGMHFTSCQNQPIAQFLFEQSKGL